VFKLVNGAGSGNYFYSTNGYSYLYAYVYASTGQGSFQKQVLADYRYNYPDAVPDFTVSDLNKTASLNLTLEDLVAGSDVTFEGYIYAEQYGNSNVPLPPTAMLLGSGLVGLALLRRRWSLKK
jgi:malonyl CoA-acyl carrier protein transacylase